MALCCMALYYTILYYNENHERTMGRHGLGEMSDNGERLVNLCEQNCWSTIRPNCTIRLNWTNRADLDVSCFVDLHDLSKLDESCVYVPFCQKVVNLAVSTTLIRKLFLFKSSDPT